MNLFLKIDVEGNLMDANSPKLIFENKIVTKIDTKYVVAHHQILIIFNSKIKPKRLYLLKPKLGHQKDKKPQVKSSKWQKPKIKVIG